jgi:hypothetical protein
MNQQRRVPEPYYSAQQHAWLPRLGGEGLNRAGLHVAHAGEDEARGGLPKKQLSYNNKLPTVRATPTTTTTAIAIIKAAFPQSLQSQSLQESLQLQSRQHRSQQLLQLQSAHQPLPSPLPPVTSN